MKALGSALSEVCFYLLALALVFVVFRAANDLHRIADNGDVSLCIDAAYAGVDVVDLPKVCQRKIKAREIGQ